MVVGIRAVAVLAVLGACSVESATSEVVASVTTPGLLGGEIAITTTGSMPAVASNGATFLVVWGDGANLRGVRVSVDGTLLDTPFVISNAGVAPDPTNQHQQIQVASNGTDYLVVWADPRNDDDIFAARVTAAGIVQDPNGFALHSGTGVQDAPRVASNGTDYLAVWESQMGDHFDIYANRIVGGAAADGNGFVVMETGYGELPAVGSLGTDYLVSWTEYRDHVQADLFGQRVTAAGALNGGNITIDNALGYQGHSAITTNGAGYLVAWDDTRNDTPEDPSPGYDMFAAHVGTDGMVADTNGIAITVHMSHQWHPAVASNGTDYFLAWEDDRNSTSDAYGDLLAGTMPSAVDGFGVATSLAQEKRPSIGYAASGLAYLIAYESDAAIHARLVKQCGDGVVQTGEGCDDGNTAGGDGCSAVCGIESGFTCTGAPSTCADIDECATSNGGCSQTCTNTVGSYACGCNAGYALAQDGTSCADINECATGNGGCAQMCTNSVGNYACTCGAGYTLGSDGHACDDVNECSIVNGGCAQLCNNAPGTFSCACNAGYTLDANNATCSDVDECATANGGCSDVCTNTQGGFTCSCSSTEGLAADGKTCMACAAGTVGDGTTCADIDECSAGTDTCGPDQTCTNTVGSFTCVDNAGCGCQSTDPRQGAAMIALVALLLRRRRRR
jgi:MYXO-CTERM domain-containing protein